MDYITFPDINPDNPVPGEGPFYTDYLQNIIDYYGEDKVSLGAIDFSSFSSLAKRKPELVKKFNHIYAFREIGQETTERWQHFLQSRFYEVAEHFDHMYNVFDEYEVDTLGTGYDYTEKRTIDKVLHSTSTGNTTGDSKYADTPSSGSSTINNPTNQTVDTGTTSATGDGTESNTQDVVIKRTNHDDHMIDELNNLVDKYKSTDNEFIKAFENCFIGIMRL